MVMTGVQSLTASVSDFFVDSPMDVPDLPAAAIDYCALFQQMPRSLVLFRTDGRVLAANAASTALWNTTLQQLPADYNILDDPQLRTNGVLPLIHRAFSGKVTQLPPMHYDVGSLTGDAERKRWFLGVVYPVCDAAGNVRFMAMIHTDITPQIEEKLASDAHAHREEHHLQQVIASSADGIVMLDQNWRIIYSNQRAPELGSDTSQIIGLCIWDAFPALAAITWDPFHKAMDLRVNVEFDHYYPEPVGRWYHIRVFPIDDGISVFYEDFTERHRAETILRENEKLAVAGRLAASIAHEINNPLESINNLLYLLEIEESQSEDARKFITLAQQELKRVAHITVNTLQYFRPAALSAVTSLQELIESLLAMFKGRIRQSGVSVETRFRPHPPLNCIASEMRQIIVNFLGNALEATPRGGNIFIRIRPQHDVRTNEAGILLTIADTGYGMSRTTLDHLYEAFYTTKDSSGTGIGLWVSHDLVRKHHGQIRVRSREARYALNHAGGTVFEIFFPFDNGIVESANSVKGALAAAPKLSALTNYGVSHPIG